MGSSAASFPGVPARFCLSPASLHLSLIPWHLQVKQLKAEIAANEHEALQLAATHNHLQRQQQSLVERIGRLEKQVSARQCVWVWMGGFVCVWGGGAGGRKGCRAKWPWRGGHVAHGKQRPLLA